MKVIFVVEVLLKWKLTVNKFGLIKLHICILVKQRVSGMYTPLPWKAPLISHCKFSAHSDSAKSWTQKEMFSTPGCNIGSTNRSQFRNDIHA